MAFGRAPPIFLNVLFLGLSLLVLLFMFFLVAGALTFLHWKMYRYFAGYATTYTASYYRSRLTYYGFLVVMVGVVQIALGKNR